MSAATDVTDETFNELVLNSDIPVLVDFWAPWCGPCKIISGVVDQIAKDYENKLRVVKLNTDNNPKTATEYEIRSIPTLMIFKEGKKVDMVVGAVPKSTLDNTLKRHVEA